MTKGPSGGDEPSVDPDAQLGDTGGSRASGGSECTSEHTPMICVDWRLEAFLASLTASSPHTVAAYRGDVRDFAIWAERSGVDTPLRVERMLLRRYVAYLTTRRFAKRSIARKVAAYARGGSLRSGRTRAAAASTRMGWVRTSESGRGLDRLDSDSGLSNSLISAVPERI